MLNNSFDHTNKLILEIKINRSLTLEDMARELHKVTMESGLPEIHKMYVILRLAEIEQRIAQGCNEKLQIASLVGAFIEIREMRVK